MLLAGLATGLMVACAGYVAMSERAVRLAPQEVIAHPSELQASAAGNDAPRADDVSVLGQREGEPVDVRRQQDQAESSPSYALDLTVEPSDAWIALDGKSVGVGRVQRRLRIDGVEHTLVIGAPGHANRTLTFRDAPPPAHVALDKSVPASSPSPSPRRRPSSDAPEKPRRGANGALILR